MEAEVDPLYRSALWCGAIPLAIGSAIFAVWTLTRWDVLMLAGFFTLFGGLIFFLAGCGFLVAWGLKVRRNPPAPRRSLYPRFIFAFALLLVNFPAAIGIVAWFDYLHTEYSVTVVNRSGEVVETFTVAGGGVESDFGPLAPGASKTRRFHFRQEGSLEYQARQGRSANHGVVDGYVEGCTGGNATVMISPGLSCEVRRRSGYQD